MLSNGVYFVGCGCYILTLLSSVGPIVHNSSFLSHNFKQCEEVVSGIETHVAALCLEALVASREIVGHRYTARGGPWCNINPPGLTAEQFKEVVACSKVTSIPGLLKVRDEFPTGSLADHIANVTFGSTAAAAASASASPMKLPRNQPHF